MCLNNIVTLYEVMLRRFAASRPGSRRIMSPVVDLSRGLCLFPSQMQAPVAVESPAEEAEQAVGEEEAQAQATASSSDQEAQELQRHKQERVNQLLAGIRQNFGKINVAPEFSEEDLVPVEMPDLPNSECGDDEEEEEEEGEGSEEGDDVKEEEGEEKEDDEKPAEEGPASNAGRSKTRSAREVNKELDEKIAKLKHFLDRAKSKHFSAIRSVCHAFSFPSP